MSKLKDKRSSELQRKLAARFGLPESTVTDGLTALMESIRGRLPMGVEVCLASWFPQSGQLVSRTKRRAVSSEPMNPDEIKQIVVEAGIPERVARQFIAAVFEFIEARLGTPLVTAIRRKVPELQAFSLDGASHLVPSRS
ncbi:MAG: hypothetical protein OEQ13_08765 [Acidobacteriota bacterium]|nr:hypothetical protein [Acidobacteriota bacterium]